ncbi:hypothetical protein ACE1SV_40650 [Streptomyces sennicomposti]
MASSSASVAGDSVRSVPAGAERVFPSARRRPAGCAVPPGRCLIHACYTVTGTAGGCDEARGRRESDDAGLPALPVPAANGCRSTGYPREINLECPANRDDRVTEPQAPVTRA